MKSKIDISVQNNSYLMDIISKLIVPTGKIDDLYNEGSEYYSRRNDLMRISSGDDYDCYIKKKVWKEDNR